jgi:hypothetical protein
VYSSSLEMPWLQQQQQQQQQQQRVLARQLAMSGRGCPQ